MLDPEEPPNPPMFKNDNIKKRYQHAKSMAVDAVNLPKIERIEKYSYIFVKESKMLKNKNKLNKSVLAYTTWYSAASFGLS